MEHAVPRSCINDVLTWCARGTNDGRCCNATWTKRAATSREWLRRVLEMLFPKQRATLYIDRVNVVRHTGNYGDFLRPTTRSRTADNQGRKQRVHLARQVVGFELPEKLHIFYVFCGQRLLVFLPGGSLRITAICQPIRANCDERRKHQSNENQNLSHLRLPYLKAIPQRQDRNFDGYPSSSCKWT